MSQFVTLGRKANFFRDPQYNISICPGEVVELDTMQLNSRRVKAALRGGHLIYTEAPKKEEKKDNKTPKKEKKDKAHDIESLRAKVESGVSDSEILATYKLEHLTAIAEKLDIEIEEGDDEASILKAIKEEL